MFNAHTAGMESLIETTPSGLDAQEMFGYTTAGLNFPGLLALVFKQKTSIAGFFITRQSSLAVLAFPNLVSITGAQAPFTVQENDALTSLGVPNLLTMAGSLTCSSNPIITSFSFPVLTKAGFTVTFASNSLLRSVSMPAFVTGGTGSIGFSMANCPVLTDVTLTNYLPTNARNQNFSGCALTQASVDHVLSRMVANPAYVSGSVLLNGGTNAAPGTQGNIDKATLTARGVTVVTN